MVKQKASEILLQFLPLKEIQEEMVNHNRLLSQGMGAEGIVQKEPTADPVQVTLVPVELEASLARRLARRRRGDFDVAVVGLAV